MHTTNRNNVKMTLLGVAVVVMVLVCLPVANEASHAANAWKASCLNSMVDSGISLDAFGIGGRVATTHGPACLLAFLALPVPLYDCFHDCFSFLALLVPLNARPVGCFSAFSLGIRMNRSVTACFAAHLSAVRTRTVLIELPQRLGKLALGTHFRYDRFSHLRFSNKQWWLEPLAGDTPVGGLLYINKWRFMCQGEF